MRQVNYDTSNNRVLIEGFGFYSPKTLEAWSNSNEVSIRLISTNKNILSEDYSVFTYEDGSAYGANKQEVIDNLNIEFNKSVQLGNDFTSTVLLWVTQNNSSVLTETENMLDGWWKQIWIYENFGSSESLTKEVNSASGSLLTLLDTVIVLLPLPITLREYIISILS